jgi:hypothetical protein
LSGGASQVKVEAQLTPGPARELLCAHAVPREVLVQHGLVAYFQVNGLEDVDLGFDEASVEEGAEGWNTGHQNEQKISGG